MERKIDGMRIDPRRGMAAEVLELGIDGTTLSRHKVIAFGGRAADSEKIVDTVEMIDFAKPQPWKWELQQPLYHPASATKVIPLPDGTVLIGGGNARRGRFEGRPERGEARPRHSVGRRPVDRQARFRSVTEVLALVERARPSS